MSNIYYPPSDIHLDPADWYIASWRNLPPLPVPPLEPFDITLCCRRLANVKITRGTWNWSSVGIKPCLGTEEGQFWLEAFCRAEHAKLPPAEFARLLAKRWPFPILSRVNNLDRLKSAKACSFPETAAVLASQFDPSELMLLLLDLWREFRQYQRYDGLPDSAVVEGPLIGFRRFVRPWLSLSQLQSARDIVRAELQRLHVEAPTAPPNDFVLSLMASLGMADELAVVMPNIQGPGWWEGSLSERHFAIFGLSDPTRIIPELKHLGLTIVRPKHAIALLAHLEAEAVPAIHEAIAKANNRADAVALTSALGLVQRADVAPVMLSLTKNSRGPAPAQLWLDEHKELAVAGILPLLGDEKLNELAVNYLRQQVRAGNQALIDSHVDQLAPERAAQARRCLETTVAMQVVDDIGVPLWFPPGEKRRSRLPSWIDPATLPPLRVEGKRLPPEQVVTLLFLLRESELDKPHPVFAQIKIHTAPQLLDTFVWAVFERWYSASGDAKDKWALTALGHLGRDGVCLPLMSLLAEWPGKSQHQRASLGLLCLKAIDTPLAWMCILQISVLSSYAIAYDARTLFSQEADRRELQPEQFQDHVIPDLGLDRDGYRPLHDGAHTYRMTVGPDRQALLIDDKKQYRSEWPELTDQDDPSQVEAARAEWTTFRTQIHAVMQFQNCRLETAMLRWRRWKATTFEQLLVRHPLMSHLSRALVWAAFETISKPRVAFHVVSGQSCVDVAGFPVQLEPDWDIGLLHPVLLPADERMVWSDVMSEEGVLLPEWQLPRTVYSLQPGEENQSELTRWQGRMLNYNTFYSASSALDYHGGAFQRGNRCCRVRFFPPLRLTVYIVHTPFPENISHSLQQDLQIEILSCHFRSGDTMTRVPNVTEAVPLSEVDPVLLDEIIGDIEQIVARATPPG